MKEMNPRCFYGWNYIVLSEIPVTRPGGCEVPLQCFLEENVNYSSASVGCSMWLEVLGPLLWDHRGLAILR